jgi:predicted transposase/invertase (TIGR01784 family)
MHSFNDPENIIDICRDGVFKAVFTKESPESRAAITSLLSAFIGKDLDIVTITTNEVPIDDTRQRQTRYDISVRFNDGELADIELTVNPKPDENLRMEYYVSRLFVSQEIRGKDRFFKDLKPTYSLSIISSRAVFKDKAWAHRFVYYDPVQKITLDGRTAILAVELEKLDEVVKKTPEDMSRQERWAVYFGYYKDTGKQGLLREIEALEEGIKMAETVVEGFTQTELENLRQISLHKAQMDWQYELYDAKQEGIAEGEARGEARGEVKGKAVGQKELIELWKSGKSLEEAKRILGIE